MIQKLFIYLTLLLVVPDIYIYKLFISRLTASTLLRVLYFTPSLLLFAGLVIIVFFLGQEGVTHHSRYMGWFIILYMIFVLPKIIFTLFSLLDWPLRYFMHLQSYPFSWIGLVAAVASIVVILYGAAIGKSRFEVKNITFTSATLPEAFNGYRIVQLSDLHIGSWEKDRKTVRKIVDLINAQKADLVVFTGDLVNHKADELDPFKDILSGIQSKNGVYAVLGNHDYGPYYPWKNRQEQLRNLEELKEKEKQMGWHLLNNSHVFLYQGKDSIALIGVENQGEPPFSQHGDLKKAMQGTENTHFKILLSHNPTHWKREVVSTDIQLMLAGHTHAMQMALGHHSPSSFIYPEWSGLYTEEKGKGLYVNVGLGYVMLPFRFGAWPEITVITLQKEKNNTYTK